MSNFNHSFIYFDGICIHLSTILRIQLLPIPKLCYTSTFTEDLNTVFNSDFEFLFIQYIAIHGAENVQTQTHVCS